jgi:hypothetical protein
MALLRPGKCGPTIKSSRESRNQNCSLSRRARSARYAFCGVKTGCGRATKSTASVSRDIQLYGYSKGYWPGRLREASRSGPPVASVSALGRSWRAARVRAKSTSAGR